MEKRRPPPRRSFARVQRLPFTGLHCKTRGVSCSRRQTPRRVEKRRPPRAVLLSRVQRSPFRFISPVPFVQWEAKASTHHRPRLMNCTAPDMDKYRQHGQPPNIEEITRHAPNMDNMDNVDKRPEVWRRGGRPRAVLLSCLPFRAAGDQSPKASTQHAEGVQRPNAARYGSAPH